MKNAAKRDEWYDRAGNPEEEWDSIDQELDPDICWQRSTHVLPRLRIVTELEEYLIPWVHVALVKSDRSFRVIEIHTSLGISFTIASATPLQPLYGMLQLERVRCIYQIEGVSVKAVMGQERWLIFQVLVLYYVTCIEYKV